MSEVTEHTEEQSHEEQTAEERAQNSTSSKGYSSYMRMLKSTSKSSQNFEKSLPHGYQEMSEEDALKEIELGHELKRCYIKRLHLSGVYSKTIILRDVYIYELSISDATFEQNFSMQGSHIHRYLASQAQFHKAMTLKGGSVHFTHLQDCDFSAGVNAELLKARSKFILYRCEFRGRLRLWEATFADWVTFDQCTFHHRCDLRSAILEAGLTMPKSIFKGDALFRGMHLAMKWEAEGARFEKLVDFSKAKLNDYVYLDQVEQGPDQRWAFWNTVSERIIINASQIEGRLVSEEKGEYAQAMREYTVLKRSFEYGNYYGREDWAFYRFKVNERRAREKSWGQPLSKILEFADWLFLDWGCGYGTNPLRAIRTSLVMIFFFACIYTLGFDLLHKPNPNQLPFPELGGAHLVNQISVSLFISLAAFTSGFGDLREVATGWMNFPLMLEALLGTLMWGLFVVAFGRKVIR